VQLENVKGTISELTQHRKHQAMNSSNWQEEGQTGVGDRMAPKGKKGKERHLHRLRQD
jgi:hypothetical protein